MRYQEDAEASSPGARPEGPWRVGQDVVAVRWAAGTAKTVEAGRGKVEFADRRGGCVALGMKWDGAGMPRLAAPPGTELLDADRWADIQREAVAWNGECASHSPAVSQPRTSPASRAIRRRAALTDGADHVVYIVRAADRRHFKIGVTGRGLRKRLAQLQTGNHQALSVVGVLAAPDRRAAESLERQLHAAYAGVRGSGEWFELTPAALAEIRAMPCVASWCDQ